MKLKKLIYLLPIFLVGCNYPIQGTLQVHSNLSMKEGNKRYFDIAPGTHILEVKRDQSWGKPVFRMKLLLAGKERRIKFLIPESIPIPGYNGPFTLSSLATGQPFDLTGEIKTIETDAPSKTYSEPCGYGYYGYYYGSRLITTHIHEVTGKVMAEFKAPGQDQILASYDGSTQTKQDLIVDAVGPCLVP